MNVTRDNGDCHSDNIRRSTADPGTRRMPDSFVDDTTSSYGGVPSPQTRMLAGMPGEIHQSSSSSQEVVKP